jgi:hypothetical protein
MPTFRITAPDGRSFDVSGDSAPTEQELEEIFQSLGSVEAAPSVNDDLGVLDAGLIAAGRGFATLGRAVGLMEPEDPRVSAHFNDLQEQHPIATGVGEVIGESAPFLLPGMGIAALPGLGLRAAGSAALGALEGGTITAGKGGDFHEILTGALVGGGVAGGLEAAFPVLQRVGGALYRRATGAAPSGPLFDRAGQPTVELQVALQKQGLSLQDLANETAFALKATPAGVNPDEALRAARFRELGVPATAGDITQDFGQQATEQRLVSMAGGKEGEPLRALQLRQSEAFKSGLERLVADLGVSDETGELVKDALAGRLAHLEDRKGELYGMLAKEAPEALNIPILTDGVRKAIPDEAKLRRISRLPGNTVDGLRELLVEFGIDRTPEAVEAFQKKGGQVLPLTIGTYEEFRQALNQLGSPSSPMSGERAMAGIVGQIKAGLDEEAAFMESALMEVSGGDKRVLDSLREARKIVQTIKTEFSPQSIAGRLIDVKRDGVTPMVEASKVFDTVMRPGAPIEHLERTLTSLNEAGAKGKQGIAALQAATVLRALDDALKAPSRKTGGVETLGYTSFLRSLRAIGDDRLALLFKDNPRTLARLKMYQQTAKDLTPAAGAVPKGSAPVLLDIVNRISRAPGIAPVVDVLKFTINAGADERAVRRAMDSTPQAKRVLTEIQNDYPAIASALGIATLNADQNEE